ncbi:hypothetical protein BKA93DRAFT_783564 [Sparassis latifolia]
MVSIVGGPFPLHATTSPEYHEMHSHPRNQSGSSRHRAASRETLITPTDFAFPADKTWTTSCPGIAGVF